MQGVFKAAMREGPQVRPSIKQALEELVGCFSALIHATDFVEVSSSIHPSAPTLLLTYDAE
jgi:nuclear pore complex protein Nup205